MVSRPETKKARIKRHKRIRSKISGTAPVSYTHLDVYKRQIFAKSLQNRGTYCIIMLA